MAFHTIWSVDLGKSALKAVKLRRDKNNIEILAIDKIDYPLTARGALDGNDDAREALSVFRTRNEVREPLVVAHPGQGTFSRFIKVPAFDAKKVKDMVRYEASQQIPFPLDEVIWDYHVVDREYMAGEEREVGLFAVRREAIDDFILDFTGEGMSVEMLTIGYLGVLNFVLFDVRPDEPLIVLDIGASHTDLIFVDGRRFWIRPLPHSGNDVTRAIMSRFRLDFAEAERLKIETAKVPKQAVKIFQAVIQPKLQELVQEVHRSIGYYRSQTGEIKFTRLLLMGNGSKIIGIKKYLEEHLRIPVERLSSISRLRVNRDVKVRKLQADLPAFGTALGCGIQAVGAGTCRVDLVPREEKIRKEIDRKKKHVYFAAGILLLCILISFALLNKKIQRAENALNTVDSYFSTEQILKWEREVRDLKGESETGYDAKTETLRRIGEARQGAVAALRALENVIVAIPNEEHVDAVVQKQNQQAIEKLLTQAREQLSEKLWIPYLQVSLIDYPEDPTGATGRSSRRRREEKPTAPAYKVTAYAVITSRESDTASNQAIATLLETPLEGQLKELKVRKLTELPQVTISPGEDTVPAVYYSPARRGGISEVPLQEGGPFYGAEVQWYMLPRLPEEPPSEDEESKEE